jgi:hypothetical protein
LQLPQIADTLVVIKFSFNSIRYIDKIQLFLKFRKNFHEEIMPLQSSLFFLLMFPALIYAGVVDHLKPALNKAESHTMRNIDFIYTINLDKRPEKWQWTNQQLQPFGISPYRFSAVNGWELTLETINDLGVKFQQGMKGGFLGTSYLDETFEPIHGMIGNEGQTYFCHCMSRGAIGCALSHLSIIKDALDSGYNTIWIMEDDIEIARDPRLLSDAITKLDYLVGKGNWDILFTDRNTRDSSGKKFSLLGWHNILLSIQNH